MNVIKLRLFFEFFLYLFTLILNTTPSQADIHNQIMLYYSILLYCIVLYCCMVIQCSIVWCEGLYPVIVLDCNIV